MPPKLHTAGVVAGESEQEDKMEIRLRCLSRAVVAA